MSRKKRKRRNRRKRSKSSATQEPASQKSDKQSPPIVTWAEDGEYHMMIPKSVTDEDFLDALEQELQARIQESELWPLLVEEYGLEKAKELLKEFKVEEH